MVECTCQFKPTWLLHVAKCLHALFTSQDPVP
jgi:hypothetical protein